MRRFVVFALFAIAIAGSAHADEADCSILQALRAHAAKHFSDIQLPPDKSGNIKSSYKIDPSADCKIESAGEPDATLVCTLWFDRDMAPAKEDFEVFLESAIPCVASRQLAKRRPYLRGETAELDDGDDRILTVSYAVNSRYWYFELEYANYGK